MTRIDALLRPVAPYARATFHVVAVVEACTWVGLLVGMGTAYLGSGSRAGIELFGPLHGAAFVAYVVVTLVAARALRWRPATVLLALVASVPPLFTAVFDVVASRRGWLAPARVAVPRTEHRSPVA